MELLQRTTSTRLHNTITNIVGLILASRPGEPMTVATMHGIVISQYGDRYTVGQILRGLKWQSESNPSFIKTRLSGFNNKTRTYWYESGN